MKILFLDYKTIFKLAIVLAIIIISLSFIVITAKNKSQETFFHDDVYYKGSKEVETVAFACNVDWGNEYIPDMLDIFKEEDIKITFFPTGIWAEKNDGILKRIDREEHEIGNHGYSHKDYGIMGFDENKEQILKADKIIKDITGVSPKFFAPPSGSFNQDTVKAAKDTNYDVIMWSVDTIDWREDSTKEKIIERVVEKVDNSAIVLMHPTENTVAALPAIIKNLKKKGYKIGRVSDVMK